MAEETGDASSPSLADKINKLFETMHARNRGPESNEEVAQAINARGGPRVSASYLWLLRTGKRDNPTARTLEALANHFGVSPAIFFNDEIAQGIMKELDLLRAMRDSGVKSLALRASDLSPENLVALRMLVEHFRRQEGLPAAGQNAADEDEPGGGGDA